MRPVHAIRTLMLLVVAGSAFAPFSATCPAPVPAREMACCRSGSGHACCAMSRSAAHVCTCSHSLRECDRAGRLPVATATVTLVRIAPLAYAPRLSTPAAPRGMIPDTAWPGATHAADLEDPPPRA